MRHTRPNVFSVVLTPDLDFYSTAARVVVMKRYLTDRLRSDRAKKMVPLTGSRHMVKTTLAKELTSAYQKPLSLNWDMADDHSMPLDQSKSLRTDLLILDEKHKTTDWLAELSA